MIKYIHDAMAAKREQLENNDKGFSLIELLVVVLILGILAAIAIPVFIGQQESASNSAAQANLANAKVAYISFYTDGGTAADVTTAGSHAAAMLNYGWPQSGPPVTVVTDGGLTSFCLTATGAGTNPEWSVGNATALLNNATCTP